MPRRGLLIEYEYCTGCRSCVVACQQEHSYPPGICGIELLETATASGGLRLDFLSFPTKHCDLCARRVEDGGRPACVKACQAATMWHGELVDLARMMEDKPHSALFTPPVNQAAAG